MTYKPGKPETDLGRVKPFWEEVPDKPPPKYEPPQSELQPPFWDTQKSEPRSMSTSLILALLILLGALSLWL